MAKQSEADKLKWEKIAENCISELHEISELVPENYQNKFYLLKAEMSIYKEHEASAYMHFRKSISLSKQYCFLHEEALACERAGMYYLGLKSQTLAVQFLQQSFDRYEDWGAYAKLKQLKFKYPNIFEEKIIPSVLMSYNSVSAQDSNTTLVVSNAQGRRKNEITQETITLPNFTTFNR